MAEAQLAAGGIWSRYLDKREDITRVLREFRDQCHSVTLRFEGVEQEYTAQVLDVTDQQVLLEDVRPRTGIALMNERKLFSLAGRGDGVYVYATGNRVSESGAERLVPYFRVALPRSMLCQQRRRTARFRLPVALGERHAKIVIAKGDASKDGTIVDLSAGGCRAEFSGALPEGIEKGVVIERCQIEIGGLVKLSPKAVIRHHNVQADLNTCGIEFTDMGLAERRRLEQFIHTLSKAAKPA